MLQKTILKVQYQFIDTKSDAAECDSVKLFAD